MKASVNPPGKYPGEDVRTSDQPAPPTGGASTSVGAFIGRAPQGPLNVPATCLSFADYERQFGGLAQDSAMSYQVYGFFNNGGTQAEIVRLYRLPPAGGDSTSPSAATGTGSANIQLHTTITFSAPALRAGESAVLDLAPPGGPPLSIKVTAPSTGNGWQRSDTALALYEGVEQSAAARSLVSPANPALPTPAASLVLTYVAPVDVTLTAPTGNIPGSQAATPTGFQLTAANPGAWGNAIVASIDTEGIDQIVADEYGLATTDLFNLTVACNGASERFTAVTLVAKAGANRLDRVLQDQSNLVRLADGSLLGTAAPPSGSWGRPSAQSGLGVASAPLQDADYLGDPSRKTGLHAFTQDPYGFNILCIPPDDTTDPNGGDVSVDIYQEAAQICADNHAMLIIDPPTSWTNKLNDGNIEGISINDLGSYTDDQGRACAVYFPRVIIADPLQDGLPRTVAPSGYLAAVWASVDAASGVWKAPAGTDAPIGGILQLQAKIDDDQDGVLNPQGINALRSFTGSGNVVWGARTLRGSDALQDPYKYIPVQRLRDYIETSLLLNTRWAVFEPNGEALWSGLRTQVTAFMNSLFGQGAFAGTSASHAFFVQCDSTTTTPADVAAGIVNIQVGFAPLYPAEFVIITISQSTASSG